MVPLSVKLTSKGPDVTGGANGKVEVKNNTSDNVHWKVDSGCLAVVFVDEGVNQYTLHRQSTFLVNGESKRTVSDEVIKHMSQQKPGTEIVFEYYYVLICMEPFSVVLYLGEPRGAPVYDANNIEIRGATIETQRSLDFDFRFEPPLFNRYATYSELQELLIQVITLERLADADITSASDVTQSKSGVVDELRRLPKVALLSAPAVNKPKIIVRGA